MLIKNAKIIVKDNETKIVDILIKNGKIEKVEENIDTKDEKIIDAKKRLTIPGGVDVHIHLREPGFEEKETIETGTLAAARGGYTTVLPMPNLNPHPDNVETFRKYLELLKKNAKVNVIPFSCITKESKGEQLADIAELNKEFGIRYFSDDGFGVASSYIMEKAMLEIKKIDGIITAHTEDLHYRKEGACVYDGENAKKHGWIGIPAEAEYKQIERDLKLAEKTGVKYHIGHLSAIQSVDLLREYKAKGIDVSGEVTIHHLLLNEFDVKDPNAKMNPPVKTEKDRLYLVEALYDGTIDFLANDHAPHTVEEKSKSMEEAPFGIINIESAIPLFYTNFVKNNKFTLEQFLDIISRKPAKRFGIKNKGYIEKGYDADIAILSDEKEEIKAEDFLSKSKNSPFIGYEVYGSPEITICGGEIVWEKKDI